MQEAKQRQRAPFFCISHQKIFELNELTFDLLRFWGGSGGLGEEYGEGYREGHNECSQYQDQTEKLVRPSERKHSVLDRLQNLNHICFFSGRLHLAAGQDIVAASLALGFLPPLSCQRFSSAFGRILVSFARLLQHICPLFISVFCQYQHPQGHFHVVLLTHSSQNRNTLLSKHCMFLTDQDKNRQEYDQE